MSLSVSLWRPHQALRILYLSFNQDFGCVAMGTDVGLRVYNCDPFRLIYDREMSGAVGIVEMIYRSNLLAVVGGYGNKSYPTTKLVMFDTYMAAAIAEIPFLTDIKAVKLRRDRLLVATESAVYLYEMDQYELLAKFDTEPNIRGIAALSPEVNNPVLAVPTPQAGLVRVRNLQLSTEVIVTAHESRLSYIGLNHDGSRLATASEKGTVIRVFDTKQSSGGIKPIREFRRGTQFCDIYSLCFSHNSHFLCVASSTATIHVFHVEGGDAEGGARAEASYTKNRTSKLSFLSGIIDYVGSEWSFAWYKCPMDLPYIAAFGPDGRSIVVLLGSGKFLRLAFNPTDGGLMALREEFEEV
eukprot:RCo011339